jgi:6-pyruvoyltetrahydropterin/6-carboxytetrahydropterin synthase
MTDVAAINKEVQFDTGHRVPGHASKCRHPHGHRYRVVAHCTGVIIDEAGAPDEGMLVDFGDLKALLTEHVHDVFDHAFVCHVDDPLLPILIEAGAEIGFDRVVAFPLVPTAENFARWIYHRLEPIIGGHWRGNLTLDRIEVWETPTSCATFDGSTAP